MDAPVEVTVIPFDQRYAKDFADLNYQWIEESYGVEQHDREILDFPFKSVIECGGEIFFALVDEEPAGTVAMIRMDDGDFELAKMAVSPAFRGKKIGDVLMRACIAHAIEWRAHRIVLESNTKQVAAINLYRKHGFAEIPLDPNSHFARANIRMELALDGR